MSSSDQTQDLQAQVDTAYQQRHRLRIVGGDTKQFYGQCLTGETLSTAKHCGIIDYDPTELVITARSGTPLHVIEAALAEQGQMLDFEPPHFGAQATLGGTLACGFSGPRRAFTGAARDFVLGCKLINGKGEVIQFGGRVIKNVAGYDVARLMVGALGTLGVLLEISLKVVPKPAQEITLVQPLSLPAAMQTLQTYAAQPLPLSAASYDGENLYVRLSGSTMALQAACTQIAGDQVDNHYWQAIKEHQHAFFNTPVPLWRLSVASTTAPLDLEGQWLFDWCGALRWLRSETTAEEIRRVVSAVGGHATLFRRHATAPIAVFHPLSDTLLKYHQRVKQAFDPHALFNINRLYQDMI